MIKRMTFGVAAMFLMLAAAAQEQSPDQVISGAANELADQLEAHGDEYKTNEDALFAMVENILNKVFDKRYAGARVLGGQVWRSATDQQKTDFVDALYNSLVKTYGTAVLDFKRNSMKVIPARAAPDGNRATVKTTMEIQDGTLVNIDYRMRLTQNKWMIYDVLIEGISYINNYHDEYAPMIQQQGLDAVIADLKKDPVKERADTGSSGSGEESD